MHLVMASDETQIEMFEDWPMSHAKRMTPDNGQNTEYQPYFIVMFLFLADQILRRSYVNWQHFRSRSLASLYYVV